MNLYEITEGYWKNIDIQNQEKGLSKIKSEPKIFTILINGKTWNKNGKPVKFTSYETALKSANTIMTRFGKATQVKEL